MPKNSADGPSPITMLRKRVTALEDQGERERAEAPAARVLTSAYAVSVIALFLSMALPWAREGGGVWFSEEGVASVQRMDGYATGWLLFGDALGEGRWLFALAFTMLLLLLGFALACLLGASKGVLVTTAVVAFLTPVLYFVAWFPSLTDKGVSAGSGVFVMVVACVVIGLSASGEAEKRL